MLTVGKALKLCKEKNIPTFVFISSCSVYGELSNTKEDTHLLPISINGHTKLFGEELVKDFCTRNKINFLILRPFNAFGANDVFSVISKILHCYKNEIEFKLVNDGIAERDFIHVDDIAELTIMLIEKNLKNETINIGTSKSIKVKDIISMITNNGKEFKYKNIYNENESTFSRANIAKLDKIIGNFKFRSVEEYVLKEINKI